MSEKFWRLAPFLPGLFFLLVTFGFWGQYPSLDPMLNYRDAVQLHQTGFRDLSLTQNGRIIHPPLLNVLISAGFSVFGQSPFAYNAIGFSLFVLTSLVFYKFARQEFDRQTATLSSLLLFGNPLMITNFFYGSYEMPILVGLVFLLRYHSIGAILPLALTLAFFPLMKETALVIPLLFLLWLIIKKRFNFFLFIPFFVVWGGWLFYSNVNQLTAWRDVSGFFPSGSSSFQIVMDGVFRLKLFNSYLLSHLFNLFVFNFQWVYLALIVSCLFIRRASKFPPIIILLALISAGYIILALSYPTWTIVRYTLPLYPFLFLLLAFLIFRLPKYLRMLFIFTALSTTLISNIGSFDPITRKIFPGDKIIYGTNFYNTPFLPYSLDGANYNRDFLLAVKNQNELIQKIVTAQSEIVVTNCQDLKLSEKLWTISITQNYSPTKIDRPVECVNSWDVPSQQQKINSSKTAWF